MSELSESDYESILPFLKLIKKAEPLKNRINTAPESFWFLQFDPPEVSKIGARKVSVKNSNAVAGSLTFLGFDVLISYSGLPLSDFENAIILDTNWNSKDEKIKLRKPKNTRELYALIVEVSQRRNPDLLFPFLKTILKEQTLEEYLAEENDDAKKAASKYIELLKKEGMELYYLFFDKDVKFSHLKRESMERTKDALKLLKLNIFDVKIPILPFPKDENCIMLKISKKEIEGSAKIYISSLLLKRLKDFAPRNMSEEEISNIVEKLPNVRSFDKEVSERSTLSLKQNVRNILINKIITPLAIGSLTREMVRRYNISQAIPGSSYGSKAAHSIGRPVQQAALNSFHVAGTSKNTGKGMEMVQRILNVSKQPKYDSMKIHFKNKNLGFDGVLRYRKEYTQITVGDLLESSEIEEIQNLQQFYWNETYPIVHGKELDLKEDDKKDETIIMRLYFNVSKLYTYKVTLSKICSLIEEFDSVVCVASPLYIGIVDIYPKRDKISSEVRDMNIEENDMINLYLEKIVLSHISKYVLQGVKDITAVYPASSPVMKIVDYETKYYSGREMKDEIPKDEQKHLWYLVLHKTIMRDSGTGIENLVNLLYTCNFEILKIAADDRYMRRFNKKLEEKMKLAGVEIERLDAAKEQMNFIIIRMPDEKSLKPSDTTPKKYIQRLIKEDEEDEDKYEEENKRKGVRAFRRPDTPIKRNAHYWYLETFGTNMREIMSREEINTSLTISNNFHEVFEVLGIEAVRYLLLREFADVIFSKVKIDARHVILLVDFMCNKGKPNPITFSGLSRQTHGTLELAGFQRTLEVFKNAAASSKKDQLSSVSASIYVGQTMKAGTGSVVIEPDKEKEAKYLEQMAKLRAGKATISGPNQVKNAFGIGKEKVESASLKEEELPSEKPQILGITSKYKTTSHAPSVSRHIGDVEMSMPKQKLDVLKSVVNVVQANTTSQMPKEVNKSLEPLKNIALRFSTLKFPKASIKPLNIEE